MHASWAIVALTVVLIFVTGYYALETGLARRASEAAIEEMREQRRISQKTLEEMREQRRAGVRPIVTFDKVQVTNPYPPQRDVEGKFDYPYNVQAHVHNIGLGPVLNLRCEWRLPFQGTFEAKPQTLSVLGIADSRQFELSRPPLRKNAFPNVVIVVRPKYEDIYGGVAYLSEKKLTFGPDGKSVADEEMQMWSEKL